MPRFVDPSSKVTVPVGYAGARAGGADGGGERHASGRRRGAVGDAVTTTFVVLAGGVTLIGVVVSGARRCRCRSRPGVTGAGLAEGQDR